jgi:hypothetical protein
MSKFMIRGNNHIDDLNTIWHELRRRLEADIQDTSPGESWIWTERERDPRRLGTLGAFLDFINDEDALWMELDQPETQYLQRTLFDLTAQDEGGELKPCRHRGTHTHLTDCWICYCEVVFEGADDAEVLALPTRNGR